MFFIFFWYNNNNNIVIKIYIIIIVIKMTQTLLPLELVYYILSYREKHILAKIFENEYLTKFNKKKYGISVDVILKDLTSGINRANNFTFPQNEFTYYDDSDDSESELNNLSDDSDDDLDDNSSSSNSIVNYGDVFDDRNDDFDDWYDDDLSSLHSDDEHWGFSNSNLSVQLQGINCKICGNYVVRLYYMKDNIMCYHNHDLREVVY